MDVARRAWPDKASAVLSALRLGAECRAAARGLAGVSVPNPTDADGTAPERAAPPDARHEAGDLADPGAAVADRGQRPGALAEMRAARAELGDTPVPPSMLAALAVLEHRLALLNGKLGAASEVATWLGARVPGAGENLLLRAWTETA